MMSYLVRRVANPCFSLERCATECDGERRHEKLRDFSASAGVIEESQVGLTTTAERHYFGTRPPTPQGPSGRPPSQAWLYPAPAIARPAVAAVSKQRLTPSQTRFPMQAGR